MHLARELKFKTKYQVFFNLKKKIVTKSFEPSPHSTIYVTSVKIFLEIYYFHFD